MPLNRALWASKQAMLLQADRIQLIKQVLGFKSDEEDAVKWQSKEELEAMGVAFRRR